MEAIILLSGGLDSAVILALALEQQRHCFCLSFDYGQRHRIELEAARTIAAQYGVPHQILSIDNSAFASSALVDHRLDLPQNRDAREIASAGIPSTYVPARNTLFLSYALGFAELHQAHEIHYGANALDGSPYPDCRPAYIDAFQQLMNVATKQAIEGHPPRLITPLLYWDKKKIVTEGRRLGVPIEKTFSCYNPTEKNEPCGQCDACRLRNL